MTHAFFFLFLYFHNKTFPCINSNLLISSAYFQMCRDAQTNTVIPQSGVTNLATSLTVQFLLLFISAAGHKGYLKRTGWLGTKLEQKKSFCKLIVPNQFVALASINTKGYGPEGFGQMGPAAGERAQCPHLITARGGGFLTLWRLKVNGCRLFGQSRVSLCLNTQRWNIRQLNRGPAHTLWLWHSVSVRPTSHPVNGPCLHRGWNVL